jgi:hypothetical protein
MKHTKPALPRKGPKRCPRGHMYISWSAATEEVYCWDCNKKYLISECFDSPVASSDSVKDNADE